MGYKGHFILAMAFTGIMTFILGVFVYFKNRKNKINITFALYSFSIAWWSLTQIGNVYGPSLENSWFWARVEQMGVVFIPTFFLHFVAALLELKRKYLLRSCYAFSSIIAILSPTTKLVSPNAERKFDVINFGEPGPLYPLLLIFFIICIIYGLWKLLEAYRKSSGARKNQLKYLLYPSIIGYIGGAGNFLLVYDISIYPLNPFGTYLVGLYTFAIAYAIYKYHLMAIDLAWRYALAYLGYTMVSSAIFLPIILLLRPSYPVTVSLVFLGFFFAPYFYKELIKRFQSTALGNKYSYWNELKDFWENKREVYTSMQLADVLAEIPKVMNLQSFSFFLFDRERKLFVPIVFTGLDRVFDAKQAQVLNTLYPDDYLPLYLEKEKRIIIRDELTSDKNSSAIIEQMDKLRAQVSVPLFVVGKLTAILNLGPKKTQEMYHAQDMELLKQVMKLAEKHLAHISFFDSSIIFSGSVAHDIRKPFRQGIIFDYLSNIHKGLEHPENISSAKESLGNLKHLLANLHSMSEDMVDAFKNLEIFLKTGFRPQKIDYVRLINEESKSFEALAGQKGITFEIALPRTKLFLYADPLSVQRILNELFTNAFKYTDKGCIKVKVSHHKENEHKEILTEVSDTGCGISKEDQNEIWELFKRGKNSQTKEGAGIGLAMVRQLVEANGGKIWLNSDKGKGSSFYFSLPTPEDEER